MPREERIDWHKEMGEIRAKNKAFHQALSRLYGPCSHGLLFDEVSLPMFEDQPAKRPAGKRGERR